MSNLNKEIQTAIEQAIVAVVTGYAKNGEVEVEMEDGQMIIIKVEKK